MKLSRRSTGLGLLAFLLLAGPLFTVSAQAQQVSTLQEIRDRKELRVGWAVIYPYIYRDPKTNELVGFAVDFMNDMGEALKVRVVWVEDSWATMIAGLQSKKFDVTLPAMGVTLPRAEVVTFTNPVCRLPVGLIIQKKDAEKYPTWAELDQPDKRISVSLGSTSDLFATRKFSKAQIVRLKAGPDSIAQLLAGKVDAWADPADASGALEREHPELVAIGGPPVGSAPMAMAMRQGDFVFRDWLNLFIDVQKRTGVLKRLIDKHGLFEWTE
jgi:ABC-type amino acid transport substrate-binding protein